MPDYSANRRLKLAFSPLYGTGLRISEIVAARLADLTWQTYSDDAPGSVVEVWELTVIGKGNKERSVPISPALIAQLQAYLASRGLPSQLNAVPH